MGNYDRWRGESCVCRITACSCTFHCTIAVEYSDDLTTTNTPVRPNRGVWDYKLPLDVARVITRSNGVLLANLTVLALDRNFTAASVAHDLIRLGNRLLLSVGVSTGALASRSALHIPSTLWVGADDSVVLGSHFYGLPTKSSVADTILTSFAKIVGEDYVDR